MAETMISLDRHEHIGILTLNRGVTNALNLDFADELAEVIQDVKSDDSIRGLLLQSSNDKFFCIGFDIPQLISRSRDEVTGFYRSFNRTCLELYSMPKPTIAAITGHAIAGGCILALLCDYRYIAEGRKLMGLNEIQLGVPVPFIADCILRDLVGVRYSREIMDTGDFYTPDQTLQMGMVDKVLPLEEIRSAAREKVLMLSEMPCQAFAMIKANRVEGVVEEATKQNAAKEKAFVDRWYAEDTRRLLQEAVSKF
jgi:enoyl-CoA hydratase/carnithine racemase